MKNLTIITILLSIFITSCKYKVDKYTSDEVKVLSFKPDEVIDDFTNSGLIKDCILIPLETDTNIVIGEIKKILYHENKIYVMDQRENKAVFIFDMQGKLLDKISSYGRGPNEYLDLSDIFIDNHKLFILSYYDGKILEYIPETKSLVEKVIPIPLYKILVTDTGYIGYAGNNFKDLYEPVNIWFLDKSFNIVKGTMKIENNWKGTTSSSIEHLSQYENNYYHYHHPYNKVYQLKEYDNFLTYKIEFGKYNMPIEENISYTTYMTYVNDTRHITGIDFFQELKDNILVQFWFNGQALYGVYDKETGKTKVYNNSVYSGKYYNYIHRVVHTDSKFMISYNEAERIKEYREGKNNYINIENDYPEQVQRLREDLPEIDENDNPIVSIYFFE